METTQEFTANGSQYRIKFMVHAHFLEFSVEAPIWTSEGLEWDGFLNGSLKADGCVDMSADAMHFCGPEEAPALGGIMRQIYALGPRIKSWCYDSP